MAFAIRSLLLLCGISALLTGVWSDSQVVKVPSCPKGWTRLNERCFLVVDKLQDFADAEITCLSLGGNLASIQNAVEDEVVSALIANFASTDNAWIGYNDITTEGTFVWTDGTPANTFVDFIAVPSNPDEDCVQTFATTLSTWNDQDCDLTAPFVCATDVY
ncbi:galactose-specific lectin nattectin-like [Phyllopteryx taeniolatus]|uniref:galactose-specific lectin nattectin-like n=1 Tax=Phyllopteryx taeniolatus TaxID=161469 RepID=UPI002AD46893|nr:galactose-specific lectin nattectin-like [Phyllopteryx taeniolatus]